MKQYQFSTTAQMMLSNLSIEKPIGFVKSRILTKIYSKCVPIKNGKKILWTHKKMSYFYHRISIGNAV